MSAISSGIMESTLRLSNGFGSITISPFSTYLGKICYLLVSRLARSIEDFKEALIYQKKHLLLAEEANDTVEKQRACTQLGRTYHEIFLRSEDDCDAIQSAKKYFKIAMDLR